MSERPPLIALVGRPNVGKSTLFNKFIGRRTALVFDEPGVTRDRLFGQSVIDGHIFRVVDTGGLESKSEDVFFDAMREQTELAIEEADLVLLVLDGATGLNPEDSDVARMLRRNGKMVVGVVNKLDVAEHQDRLADFYELGLDKLVGISAEHSRGFDELLELCFELLDPPDAEAFLKRRGSIAVREDDLEEGQSSRVEWDDDHIRVAVIGRPNAGKSSLINCLIEEDRLLATELAGTTRDPVDISLERDGYEFTFVDTAGMRRKRAVVDKLERFSVAFAVRSLDEADVALLVLDASEQVSEQDAKIAALVNDRGKGLLIVANKWDLVDEERQGKFEHELERRLRFVKFANIVRVSAKTGRSVGKLFKHIVSAQCERHRRIGTAELNRFFGDVVEGTPPAMRSGKRPKLFYVTQPMVRPPTFVFMSRRGHDIQESYRRYLENSLRERYGFIGTPLWIKFRETKQREFFENPA
ncbi:MAG: ribosome biogenesis GTPase Der [Myxococcota bacterium]|nr:ribosome biogenesis GTPase Der [Myxococcota bacterium]